MADEPLRKVKHHTKMDSETFLKHMNGSHVPAAGVSHFGKSNVVGDEGENLLRAMHEHLHTHPLYADTQHQKTHTHGEAAPE